MRLLAHISPISLIVFALTSYGRTELERAVDPVVDPKVKQCYSTEGLGTIIQTTEATAENGFNEELSQPRLDIYKKTAGMISDWHQFALKRYAPFGEEAYNDFISLSPRLLPLLIDSGIVLRMRAFREFVETNNLKDGDLWMVRQRFSQHLKMVTLYRGVVLPDTAFNAIKIKGFESTLLRRNNSPIEALLTLSIRQEFINRESTDYSAGDPLVSFSRLPTVAQGYSFFGDSAGNSYVYESSVPVLDTIYPALRKEWFQDMEGKTNMPSIFLQEGNVETFVPLVVPSNELTRIFELNRPTSFLELITCMKRLCDECPLPDVKIVYESECSRIGNSNRHSGLHE